MEESTHLIDLPSGLEEPSRAETIPPYHRAFEDCIVFSRQLWPGGELCSLRPIKQSRRGFVKQVMRGLAAAGVTQEHFAGAAGQALKWSAMLAPAVAEITGLRAWPTIGQLWSGPHRVLGVSWSDLRSLASRGVHAEQMLRLGLTSLNWHAWITLETAQIVDLTFPSTLARHAPLSFGEFAGTILCGLESELIRNHRYLPMVAGESALQVLQAKSSIPLLGGELDDLLRYTVGYAQRTS